LGDDYNGREALRAVNLIKLEGVAESIVTSEALVILPTLIALGVGAIAKSYCASRREKFHELQHSVQRFLETES